MNYIFEVLNQIGSLDLEEFSNTYLRTMGWLFIVLAAWTIIWYGKFFIMRIILKRKLKKIREYTNVSEKMNEFQDFLKKQKMLLLFRNYEWFKSWSSYVYQYKEYERMGDQFVPDVYDYMFEENIVHKYGNRKLAETIPMVFVSAGILGTFIGLVSGISELNLDAQSEELRFGIQDLLGGMEIAFYSSIFGISLSLAWHLLDKVLFYPMLVSSHRSILSELDLAFPSQDEGHYLQQMVENQKSQIEGFQEFMSEQMIPKLVSGIGEQVAESLRPQMDQTNDIINEALNKANDQNQGALQNMTDEFLNSLNESTKDYMDSLAVTLDKTVTWSENVHSKMVDLVESMNESASNQQYMAETTRNLSEQVEKYIERLSESENRQLETINAMEQVTANNAQVNDKTASLLSTMGDERDKFSKTMVEQLSIMDRYAVNIRDHNDRQKNLNESIETILEKSSTVLKNYNQSLRGTSKIMDQYELNTEKLSQITSNMANVLTAIESQSNYLLSVQNDWEQLSAQVLSDYKENNILSREVAEKREMQIDEIKSANEALHHVWTDANKRFEELNKQLDSAMTSFANQLHKGLDRTFTEYDQELSKTVNHLTTVIEMINDGVEDLPDSIEALGDKLKSIQGEDNSDNKSE